MSNHIVDKRDLLFLEIFQLIFERGIGELEYHYFACGIREREKEREREMEVGIGYLLMEVYKAIYEAVLPQNFNLNLITPTDLTSNLQETQTTEEHAKYHQKDALFKIQTVENSTE